MILSEKKLSEEGVALRGPEIHFSLFSYPLCLLTLIGTW